MKAALSIAIFLALASCAVSVSQENPPDHVLVHHRSFSSYTDPGEFGYLYDNLPTSFDKLCFLIKKQLIHPFDVEKFGKEIPEDRKFEDQDFPTIAMMLAELLKRDENGLIETRKPEDRLVVACIHHGMLLTSILRHQGVPVRIRVGYANYIGDRKDLRVSHAVCEIWDKDQNKWLLVDPDRNKLNLSHNEFEFACETWNKIRKNNLDRSHYISRYGHVVSATIHLLVHDLSNVLGEEKPYWIDPQIVSRSKQGISEITKEELEVLDSLAVYLASPDKHLKDLQRIVVENEFLQINEGP